jgi:hypothetical protein
LERIDQNAARRKSRKRLDIVDAAPPGSSLASASAKAPHRPGTALFQQQCWVWGRDSRRVGGNLLVEYGFEKSSPPKLEWGSSCYHFAATPTSTIRMWGFGLLHSDVRHGALFLQSAGFEPKLAEVHAATADVWRPEQIGRLRTPRLPSDGEAILHLLPPLLAWIGAYEQWVLDTFGVDYRHETLNGWDDKIVDPHEVPGEWWNMAAAWREMLS